MKPFAFVLVSALVLAAIYAYAAPTYGGASAGPDSVQVPVAPFRLAEGRSGSVWSGSVCGNGIGNIGYCNDIELRFRKPAQHRAATAGP
jgi:hypothetical protein